MRGAYTHNWDPYWNTAIYGAYAQLTYSNGGANAAIVQPTRYVGCRHCGYHLLQPGLQHRQIGLITRWTPVKNLTFSADVTYTMLDQKFAGTIAAPAGPAALSQSRRAVYELRDQNTGQLAAPRSAQLVSLV